jgi:hypothetical protein
MSKKIHKKSFPTQNLQKNKKLQTEIYQNIQ